MSESDYHRLSAIIEEEVKSGQVRLKPSNVKEIKNICRKKEELVKEAFLLLRKNLERNHAEARWSTFLLIKELFERSHTFRELLIDDLNEYLILVAEIDRTQPLPAPKPVAIRLKEHAISTFTSWFEKFGATYKKLALAFTFLRDTQKIKISNPSMGLSIPDPIVDARQNDRRVFDQRRTDLINAERQECQEELETLLTEVENLFHIVVPNFEEIISTSSQSTSSFDPRHHGLPSTSFNIEVRLQPTSFRMTRSPENDAIVEKIEENSLFLNKKFLPKIIRWLAVLSKSGADSENLKNCIDVKQRLENALRKAATLGIEFVRPTGRQKKSENETESEEEEEEEDEFEEVPEKEGLETIIPPNKRKEYGLEMVSQNAQRIVSDDEPCCSKNLDTQIEDGKNGDLFSRAPVVAFGPDLEDWGKDKNSSSAPSFPIPFGALHTFWRSPDLPEDFTNQEVTAAMSNRAIAFAGKFEPVKWFCRAPLPNGQLCSRMDREKCPFHGKIVARGLDGVPALEEDRIREMREKEEAQRLKVPDWQEPEFLRDIEAQTGMNLKVEKRKKRKKDGNLSDVKKLKDNPRTRLEKIVLHPSTVKRVAGELDQMQKKNAAEKFAHNWNYTFNQ